MQKVSDRAFKMSIILIVYSVPITGYTLPKKKFTVKNDIAPPNSRLVKFGINNSNKRIRTKLLSESPIAFVIPI